MLPLCQTHVCPYEGPIIDAIALLYVSFKRFFRHAPASGWASCLHQEQFSSQAVGTMKRSLVPTSSPVAAGMNAADLQLIEQRAHNQIWPRALNAAADRVCRCKFFTGLSLHVQGAASLWSWVLCMWDILARR